MFPELPPPIAAAVQEALEFLVGHLVPVHEVIAQLDRLDVLEPRKEDVELSSGNSDHLRWNRGVTIQPDHRVREGEAHEIQSSVSWRLDSKPVGITPAAAAEREKHAVGRGAAEQTPGGVRSLVCLAPHLCPRRVG